MFVMLRCSVFPLPEREREKGRERERVREREIEREREKKRSRVRPLFVRNLWRSLYRACPSPPETKA